MINYMNPFSFVRILLCVAVFLCCQTGWAGDFFSVKKVDVYDKPPKPNYGILKLLPPVLPVKVGAKKEYEFVPCIEAKVATKEITRMETLYARAYFYDARGGLLASVPSPATARRGSGDEYAMPPIFPKQKQESLFFPIPAQLIGQKWRVVVVFGDAHDAAAGGYPGTIPLGMDYPEKKIVDGRARKSIERKPDLDPIVEYVVKTSNPSQPKITLLLRAPDGVKNPAEIQGVMAMCLLGNSVEHVKRQLQRIDIGSDVQNMIAFANKHKLAIVCWGTGGALWNAGANHDELSRQQNQKFDKGFDEVADAWERGVKELQEKYGLPDRNYLLVGICASAQWAHRLAMRKPDYFLAAYLHIPSSFDQPSLEANKMLWLLTTGELDGGYVHSMRFYQDCQKMGYPMIYKPIMHLGHAGSPVAENLATRFFEYALSVKDQREAYDKGQKDSFAGLSKRGTESGGPWLESFRTPEFYGDCVNQERYPAKQVAMIPAPFRVPLPTKIIADAWNR